MIDKLSKVGQEGGMLEAVWRGSGQDGIADHTGTREWPSSINRTETGRFNGVIVGIREDPGLGSKGFAEKSIVQIVAGTVRRSVGIHRITSRRMQTKWFCGLFEGPSGPWISRH